MKRVVFLATCFILFLLFSTGRVTAAPNLKVTEVLFSGPKTTKMSSIKDFTKVKNLVLDTNYTLIFRIEGPIDLTDENTIAALNAIEYDWVFSRWGVYSPPSWWKKYQWKEPFIVTTNNNRLTGYIPEVLTNQDDKELSLQINISQLTADKYEFIIDKPVAMRIGPNVTISAKDSIDTTESALVLKGKTSHLDIFLSITNVETKEKRFIPIQNINKSDGSFSFSIFDLQEGENNVEITYSRIMSEPVVISKIKIIYKPTLFAKVKSKITEFFNQILLKLKIKKETKVKANKQSADLVGFPTEETKKWLLASGAMLSVKNRDGFDKLEVDRSVGVVKSEILDGWGIVDRESAIKILNWLKDSGHRAEFLYTHAIIMMSTNGNAEAYDEFRDKEMAMQIADGVTIKSYDFAFKNRESLYPKSLVAWDFVRLVNVARWSYTAGYISEDEAWRYMLLAGQKLQSEYSSWKQLADHYILGRTYWNHNVDHPELQSSINYLLSKNSESLWNKYPWNQKLEVKSGDLMSLPKLPDSQKIFKDKKNYDCKKFIPTNGPVVVKVNFVSNKKVPLDKSIIGISPSDLCPGPFISTEHWLEKGETSWTSPELVPNQYVISFVRGNYKELIYKDINLEKGSYEISFNF